MNDSGGIKALQVLVIAPLDFGNPLRIAEQCTADGNQIAL